MALDYLYWQNLITNAIQNNEMWYCYTVKRAEILCFWYHVVVIVYSYIVQYCSIQECNSNFLFVGLNSEHSVICITQRETRWCSARSVSLKHRAEIVQMMWQLLEGRYNSRIASKLFTQ